MIQNQSQNGEKKLRIIFMGTPDFAREALQALAGAGHDIICVYSQPPRPKGRGHKVQPSPVHEYAEKQGIAVYTPKSLKGAQEQAEFAAHNADIAVVAAYGLILPRAVLEAPKLGCINIHASILPRWRGASPIQHAIWKGDDETGVTLMQMDEGLDTGAMIAIQKIAITGETTAASLHDDLATMGGEMIVRAMNDLERTRTPLSSTAQDNDQSCYAPMLKKSDGVVDWNDDAKEIDRQIRALTPWPGVYSDIGESRFKIGAAAVVQEKSDQIPGTILNKDGHVQCGGGSVLQIKVIQPSGKKPMDFSSALNGGYVKAGDIFQ